MDRNKINKINKIMKSVIENSDVYLVLNPMVASQMTMIAAEAERRVFEEYKQTDEYNKKFFEYFNTILVEMDKEA